MAKMYFQTVFALFLVLCVGLSANGQVVYGTNEYVEYHPGDLPIVVSVPHGGYLMPPAIPDRTCLSPVYAQDAFTLELGQRLDSSLYELTGCRPHVVYCNLHRRKLDANRNLAAGACGNADAETAWQEFHGFIDSAQESASEGHAGQIFFIDLHGHGNPIQRMELGYLLYDDELDLPDETLNTATFVGYSSIQNLVSNNATGATHAELLRGPHALGTLLGNRGYPSVPSEQIPAPGTTTNYFSGGYITFNHTSYANGNDVNGVQMECNFANVRDTHANRKAFADSLAVVLADFMGIHYELENLNCNTLSTPTVAANTGELTAFPNPVAPGGVLKLTGHAGDLWHEETTLVYALINNMGTTIDAGHFRPDQGIAVPSGIAPGTYILRIVNGQQTGHVKVVVFSH